MATWVWWEASSHCHQSRWHLWRFIISPYCCAAHTRGFFKWWKNEMFLSFCFLLSASPPCSSTHAKSQWHWLSYTAVLHSCAQFSWPHGYMILPSTVLPAHWFCLSGSGCLLIIQKAGGNVTSGVGSFSANLRIRTGFSGSISLVFLYLSLLYSESAGTENIPFLDLDSFKQQWKPCDSTFKGKVDLHLDPKVRQGIGYRKNYVCSIIEMFGKVMYLQRYIKQGF